MRVNIKLLADAVPEAVEIEFIYENLMTSIVVSTEEAAAMMKSLGKVLRAVSEPEPVETPMQKAARGYGLDEVTLRTAIAMLKGGNKIMAIKEIRSATSLGLKEAKDLSDLIDNDIKFGKL